MAECEVLEGDGRRPEEYGAKERPETDHEYHGAPRHQAWRLSRDSTGSAVDAARQIQTR